MSNLNLAQTLATIEPKTKAAKLREIMPTIEQKLSAGVRIAEILHALNSNGMELSKATLKSYLYRYRKKQGEAPKKQIKDVEQQPMTTSISSHSDTLREANPKIPASHDSISIQEIDHLMKPDPAKQAEEMAYYERLAKQNRRSGKS